jgi:hypothetical protein
VERLALRRIVLLGTPLALAVLEIFHPHPTGVADAVEQGALAVYLLTEGLEGQV